MAKQPANTVTDKDGLQGIINPELAEAGDSDSQVLVSFQNGIHILVPTELLEKQEDGSYQVSLSVDELQERNLIQAQHNELLETENESSFVLSVLEEQAQVHIQTAHSGTVKLHKTVHERVELVDKPLHTEEVDIERVTINRPIAEAPAVRYEGDTLVVPLVEEVLYVEKRLVLREEIRITKLRKETHAPQQVTLRQEQIEIERTPGAS
jgi:uncharacterized protein (TIGR02271 family)